MKKSELKNYIRENIVLTLSEDKKTQQDTKDTEELTKAMDDLAKAKEEAGIEEKVAKTVYDVIDPAEYGMIGQGYLKGFNRPHSLDLDQLETLGRKVVDSLYKGDFDAAKAKFIDKKDEGPKEKDPRYIDYLRRSGRDEYADELEIKENEGGNFAELKKYQKMLSDAADFYRKKAKELGIEDKIGAFNKGINDLETAIFDEDNKRSGGKIDENEDKEPSKAELKKNKGLAKAKEELALLTREMKSLAKKYSKAEGEEKEKLVADLKKKTKLKKELEAIIDK